MNCLFSREGGEGEEEKVADDMDKEIVSRYGLLFIIIVIVTIPVYRLSLVTDVHAYIRQLKRREIRDGGVVLA